MPSESHLYVPEGGDLHVARPPLGEQEETFLGHGNLANSTIGLHGAGQLVHTFILIQMVHQQGRQVDLLCLCLCLLPAVVEISERFGVDLFLMT